MVIIKNQEVCHVEINKNANAQKKIFLAHVCLPDDTILVHSCLKGIGQKKATNGWRPLIFAWLHDPDPSTKYRGECPPPPPPSCPDRGCTCSSWPVHLDRQQGTGYNTVLYLYCGSLRKKPSQDSFFAEQEPVLSINTVQIDFKQTLMNKDWFLTRLFIQRTGLYAAHRCKLGTSSIQHSTDLFF